MRFLYLHADKPAGAGLGNQLDESTWIEVGQRPRNVLQGKGTAVGFNAGPACFVFTVANGGDLRVGEDDHRHCGQFQRRVPAGHIDRGAGTGRRCYVDQLWLVGAIARSVDVRGAGAHPPVDDDGTLGVDFHARRVEIQVAGVRRSAGSDQQSIGANFAATGRQHELCVRIGDLAGLHALQHFNAFIAKCGGDRAAYGGISAEEEPVPRQNAHLAAKSGEGLGEFDRHHRRTDQRQPLGNAVARQRLGGGSVRGVLKAGDRRKRRARAGGDEAAVKTNLALAIVGDRHDQRLRVFEPRDTADHCDGRSVRQNTLVLGVAQLINPPLLLGQQALTQDLR